jgi:circadian clock protein KaiC
LIVGGSSVTDLYISTITDSIILLRYAEIFGTIHRVTTILKMRGSRHDKNIYEFDIGENGMTISDKPFHEVNGILGGFQLPVLKNNDKQDTRP